ncbi:UDP-N-acetylmuramoyl-tripeptide--D-alanyl-D-alanine ligase [Bizionia sediminis]|uniref:UDP-N-acetylmuramoyl-tripeptide--D-alanyl-D-alanine ligase n=1 Tax=Bizionia sediminis TaxID=1737064 RepID=A0ABW5KP02_9FLAO
MEIHTLHKYFLNCSAACTDTRNISKNSMFFALKGTHFDGNSFAAEALKLGAKYVVIDNPQYAVNEQTIVVNSVLETLQNLATYHRHYLGIPILALTGSNGKTTTKELINGVLSQQFKTSATKGNLNNHIGVPLTLLAMTTDTEIGIVEMGANHQKEIAFLCNIAQPDYGYITNFGKAHLEGFGGVDGVIKGKSEMYDYLITHNKYIFINADDPIQVSKTKTARIIPFGTKKNQKYTLITLLEANPFVCVKFKDQVINSHLIGAYNFNNIAAAISIGLYFKVPFKSIKKAIELYVPTNNRSQIISREKTTLILDAYNANPSSMAAALHHFALQKETPKTAILGDMFELGSASEEEHDAISSLAVSLPIDQIILIGSHFFQTKTTHAKIERYKTFNDFKTNFKPQALMGGLTLIKGSRGMALERVLDLIAQ